MCSAVWSLVTGLSLSLAYGLRAQGFWDFRKIPEPRTDRTGTNTSERPSTPPTLLHLHPPSSFLAFVNNKTRHCPDYHHRGHVTRLSFHFCSISSTSLLFSSLLPSFPFSPFTLFSFEQRHRHHAATIRPLIPLDTQHHFTPQRSISYLIFVHSVQDEHAFRLRLAQLL